MQKKIFKIAVIGLANVGKTTFINTFAGSNLKTANFSGSTTGIKEIATFYNNKTVILYDLPGFTSFNDPKNALEQEAVNFLKQKNYDAILHIVNSEFSYFSNLLQTELEENLNCKILTCVNFSSLKISPKNITKTFEKAFLFSANSKENTQTIIQALINEEKITEYNILNVNKIRFNSYKITKKIDFFATSKIFGLPIFFLIMFVIFWLSFVIGKNVGDFLVLGFNYLIELTKISILTPFLKIMLQSLLMAVGTVIGFTPPIIVCITLIGLLEQTGYITRVSYLLDKFFEKFGLGGKSLIPLIIGAGCSITAYMSARMINNEKERFLTMIIIGFVPCTAKLSVFMLFSIALFGNMAPIVIFTIYLLGFIIGLFVAKLLGMFIKQENYEKTKIELYTYKIPSVKSILKLSYSRTLGYLKNAGTFIAIFATGLSFLSFTGIQNGAFVFLGENEISSSFIGIIGNFLEPIFLPLAMDFKMIISLITGLVAKEMAIGTLAVLYQSSAEELTSVIQSVIGFKQAIIYIVFMFFYLPCVSATASFYREVRSYKKTVFLIIFTMLLAYSFALLAKYILYLF